MDAVKKDVEALAEKELEAANKKFPLFNSAHEGYGVLIEELGELKDEIRDIKEYKKLMKEAIHKNNNRMVFEYAEIMGFRAIHAAVEAIQVAAMCEKFKMSLSASAGKTRCSIPKNADKVRCRDCDFLIMDGDKPFCGRRDMSTKGLDDWHDYGKKRCEEK